MFLKFYVIMHVIFFQIWCAQFFKFYIITNTIDSFYVISYRYQSHNVSQMLHYQQCDFPQILRYQSCDVSQILRYQ